MGKNNGKNTPERGKALLHFMAYEFRITLSLVNSNSIFRITLSLVNSNSILFLG